MNTRHFQHWPPGLPHTITLPETSVYENLEIAARRYPSKTAIIFYDHTISYRQLHVEVNALAGYLQQVCGVKRGDRVLLNMQNSPQFVIAYYAIMRADAMVVPVNPMMMSDEIAHFAADSGAQTTICAQEVFSRVSPLFDNGSLKHAVVATYSDYLDRDSHERAPDFIREARRELRDSSMTYWADALALRLRPTASSATPTDPSVIVYTSGTTGTPKGALHNHRSPAGQDCPAAQ